jgi:hypothetical protein
MDYSQISHLDFQKIGGRQTASAPSFAAAGAANAPGAAPTITEQLTMLGAKAAHSPASSQQAVSMQMLPLLRPLSP